METDGTLLLSAAQVITGEDGVAIDDGAVLVRGAEIVGVGRRSNLAGRHDGPQVAFDDHTLLPGLVDCHEHLTGSDKYGSADPFDRETDAMYALVAAYHCGRLLNKGVTTARIPSLRSRVDLSVRKAIAEGFLLGPRLFCAGQMITMHGGHGAGYGVGVSGPAEAAREARLNIAAGADFLKLAASGGIGVFEPGDRPNKPQLTREELAAAIEVAHNAGRRATAHANGEEGIGNALAAGIDCIEHGIFLTEAQAKDMGVRGVFLVPTIHCIQSIAARWAEFGVPPIWGELAEASLEPHLKSFRYAVEAGIVFGVGTDGYGEQIDELEVFTSAGISPLDAIQAATWHGALICAPEPTFGQLRAGFAADILAVRGDPLASLDVLRHPSLVVVGGEVVGGTDAASEPVTGPLPVATLPTR
jgi:imidazolonepropionase-like amidohydrolase